MYKGQAMVQSEAIVPSFPTLLICSPKGMPFKVFSFAHLSMGNVRLVMKGHGNGLRPWTPISPPQDVGHWSGSPPRPSFNELGSSLAIF